MYHIFLCKLEIPQLLFGTHTSPLLELLCTLSPSAFPALVKVFSTVLANRRGYPAMQGFPPTTSQLVVYAQRSFRTRWAACQVITQKYLTSSSSQRIPVFRAPLAGTVKFRMGLCIEPRDQDQAVSFSFSKTLKAPTEKVLSFFQRISGTGFEPAIQKLNVGFQNRCHKPLDHPLFFYLQRESNPLLKVFSLSLYH